MNSYQKLSHVGPVGYKDFYSNLKPTIAKDEYEQFLKMFQANDWIKVGDWLRVYNVADVVLLIQAFKKMVEECYPDKIDACKDAVSIAGISMTYVLQKSLKKNQEA